MTNIKKKSVYEDITERIIDALEAEVIPWARPWETAQYGQHRNAVTDRPYHGLNIMLLNLAAITKGFVDPRWLTFRNAEKLGGHIKKGEKGVGIVFWKFHSAPRDEDIAAGNVVDRNVIPFARMYTVFNVEQCEGIELPPLGKTVGFVGLENEEAEMIISLPEIVHGGSEACYSKSRDRIVMPCRESFETLVFYYSTAFHETVHWSGHQSRLNREFGLRFGDQDYAFEEMIAEIGSAFLGSATGLPFENMRHPEYINTWLQIFKKDTRAIFTAATKAQVAANFILDMAGSSFPVFDPVLTAA